MKQKIALLVIDPQNDFVDKHPQNPDFHPALAVPGASDDLIRLSAFLGRVGDSISTVMVSLDSHQPIDIAHPSGWVDKNGVEVGAFTPISADACEKGEFRWNKAPRYAIEYTRALENNGEFQHFIWPPHCLIGTPGHNVYPVFMDALQVWSKATGQAINFVAKGSSIYVEHFGIFAAQIPHQVGGATDPATTLNMPAINTLASHDIVYLAGEARSHCVATSLKQLLDNAPQLASKLVILTDCTSNVAGLPADFYTEVEKIYDRAKSMGVQFMTSDQVQF